MRTPTERSEARREIMAGVNDHDTTVVEAILELCRTLDELGERTAAAHHETFEAIERLSEKQAAAVR
jgi:hypothetical protein